MSSHIVQLLGSDSENIPRSLAVLYQRLGIGLNPPGRSNSTSSASSESSNSQDPRRGNTRTGKARKPRQCTTYSISKWTDLLSTSQVPSKVLDSIVLDYLLCVGNEQAAQVFMRECRRKMWSRDVDLGSVKERNEIRVKVLKGDIKGVIARLNSGAPGLLSQRPLLLFQLKKNALIELISQGDDEGAIRYAQTELAPLAATDSALKKELEQVLSLLIFEDISTSPLAHLVDPKRLTLLAQDVNAALLEHVGQEPFPILHRLIQESQWIEDKLVDSNVRFPSCFMGGGDEREQQEQEGEK